MVVYNLLSQENSEDGVRPGSQGLRGFPWSPSMCGVPRYREGGMAGIATLSFRKVGATSPSRWSIGGVKIRIASFVGWEDLTMNAATAAPPNTEHELLLEAGSFWSR